MLLKHWQGATLLETFDDLLSGLAVFEEVVVEKLENVLAHPVEVCYILHFVVPLFLHRVFAVVLAQLCVDLSHLAVFLLENTHPIASVEVFSLLHVAQVKEAVAHLLVHHHFRKIIFGPQGVL